MYSLNASDADLAALALKLGADCPFFIYNRAMYAEGIGEKLEEIELSLDNYHIVLIKPDVFVSTKDAFSKIVPCRPSMNLREIARLPIEEWKYKMVNDFEKSVFSLFPQIEKVKNKLYEMGAVYASMTGSGSSVYGIFAKKTTDIDEMFSDCFVWES